MELNSEKRLEFAVFLDSFIIVKREFTIMRYVKESIHTFDFFKKGEPLSKNQRITFNYVMEWCCEKIKSELAYKSNCWYLNTLPNAQVDESLLEFNQELDRNVKPYSTSIEVRLTDLDENKLVYSRIIDATQYHPAVLNRIDLTNKTVRVIGRNGEAIYKDRDEVFKNPTTYMTPDLTMQKLMCWRRPDVISACLNKIINACSYSKDAENTLEKVPSAYTDIIVGNEEQGTYKYTTSLNQYQRMMNSSKRR